MTHIEMYNLADFRKLEKELQCEKWAHEATKRYIETLKFRVNWLEEIIGIEHPDIDV